MGTRAVYTFKSEGENFSVYQHWDGYPEWSARCIIEAQALAWSDGRFEAAEFSAAFIAANKKTSGNIYLTKNHQAHGDLSYRYVIYSENGRLSVDAYQRSYSTPDKLGYRKIFSGDLEQFAAKYPSSVEAA